MAIKKGRERLRILVWFSKLRASAAATPVNAAEGAAAVTKAKPVPALVRVLSLPVTKTNLRTLLPTVLASHSEKLRRSMSHNNNTPLPLTAKNVAALNASQSFYSTRFSCPAELLKGQALHRAWDDWDAASSGMSSLQDTPVKRRATCTSPILEDLQVEAKEVEGAASSSCSPAASQIPAGHTAARNTGTTIAEANSTSPSPSRAAEANERLLSHYIDNLTLSQPHGESISQHVRGLQAAIDQLLQQNAQLRQELQVHSAEQTALSSDAKAVHHAMNAVCADLVKLQLEVKAKDQVIGKLRMQISSVQQMLQA